MTFRWQASAISRSWAGDSGPNIEQGDANSRAVVMGDQSLCFVVVEIVKDIPADRPRRQIAQGLGEAVQ